MEAIEKVKTGSHEVKAATAEQVDSSRRISAVSENVSTQAAQIASSLGNQKQKSDDITAFTGRIQKTTADLVASAEDMNRSIHSLKGDAQTLMGELSKFKT
jgi:methyl-accepting chemotaxis protein